jgi:hypothetical protein
MPNRYHMKKKLDTTIRSEFIITEKAKKENYAREKITLPTLDMIKDLTVKQAEELRVVKIVWRCNSTETDVFSMTLSNGLTCKAGTGATNKTHEFNAQDKISKIEVYEKPNCVYVEKIIFFDKEKVLCDTMPTGKA